MKLLLFQNSFHLGHTPCWRQRCLELYPNRTACCRWGTSPGTCGIFLGSGKAPSNADTNRAEWRLAFPHLEQGHDRHPSKQQYFAAPSHLLQRSLRSPPLSLHGQGDLQAAWPPVRTVCLLQSSFRCIRVSFKDLIHCQLKGSADTGGGELFAGSSAMMQSSSSTGSISSTSSSASSFTSSFTSSSSCDYSNVANPMP